MPDPHRKKKVTDKNSKEKKRPMSEAKLKMINKYVFAIFAVQNMLRMLADVALFLTILAPILLCATRRTKLRMTNRPSRKRCFKLRHVDVFYSQARRFKTTFLNVSMQSGNESE